MSDLVALGEPVAEICRRLDLRYEDVGRIDIWPSCVEVLVFKTRDGKKYVDPVTGDVAVEKCRFEVTT